MAQARKSGREELEAKQAYWDKRIAQWRDSGLSQRLFCESQGLALSTFQWWRKRLAESPSGQPRFRSNSGGGARSRGARGVEVGHAPAAEAGGAAAVRLMRRVS
jgi:hypothetical protein